MSAQLGIQKALDAAKEESEASGGFGTGGGIALDEVAEAEEVVPGETTTDETTEGGDATGTEEAGEEAGEEEQGGEAETDPFATSGIEWPECEDVPECDNTQYFNPLACKCFRREYCPEPGCEAGTDLDPAESCSCVAFSVIKSYYPDWATLGDVQLAHDKGLEDTLAKEAEESGTLDGGNSGGFVVPDPETFPEEVVEEEETED